jgi:plastocyanin
LPAAQAGAPTEDLLIRSSSRLPIIVAVGVSVALAGCASSGGTPLASTSDAATHAGHPSSAPASASAPADDTPPADATRLEDGATISMAQFAFSEAAVIVPLGATLTFVNEDNVGHTVTNGVQGFPVDHPAFNEPVAAGDSVEITFDEPGRYDITCEPHPIMQMTVFVEG